MTAPTVPAEREDAATAEPEHTGGMIALVPANPDQLTVDGGDPADILHLTLAYLGDDVTQLDDTERAHILDTVRALATTTPPVEGEVMGHAAFNPTGAHDREPCAVHLVTGDALPKLKAEVAPLDKGDHPVFLPHITAGYGITPDQLSFVGPVTFDRIRVALADQVHDFPLGETQEEPVTDTLAAAGATVVPDTIEATGPAVNGEIPINLPVIIIEGLDTSDGRFLAAGSVKPRALPLTLHAQPEASHGGDDPGPAGVVGRIDTLERIPGPQVISKRSGQPFPEGTFVWTGTGVIWEDARVREYNVPQLFLRNMLRGISADLAGMDYEVLGDESGMPLDPDHPRRQIVAHAAELGGATLVSLPAFGDCYAELAGDTMAADPASVEEIEAAGLVASAVPAWRSPEVGDRTALVASAAIDLPDDAVDQLTKVIDDGTGVQRDAAELAQAIVDHITTWAGAAEEPEPEMPPGLAAAADPVDDAGEGDPTSPQSCEMGPEPAIKSLLFRDDTAFAATCAEHEQDVRDQLAASGETISSEVDIEAAPADKPAEPDTMADQPVDDIPLDDEPGLPDAPQDCLLGDNGPHPATQSLLFDGGAQFLATCDEHADQAAADIQAQGFEVEDTVPIAPSDAPALEEVPA